MKTVAIHQPNFFPWLGYFNKIALADVFVFLDHVQFPKTGGTWMNRVKLLSHGEAKWSTAAIDRDFSGTRPITQMQFSENHPWQKTIVKTLEANYVLHPFFGETMAVIKPVLLNCEPNLAEYNITAVTEIAKMIGLDVAKFRRSSQLRVEGSSNELLCALTHATGGSIYMCGGGASGYQEESVFNACGIKLLYQNFQHPDYPQCGQATFIGGLSILDALMNLGWSGVRKLLEAPPHLQNS
jgi:hypothetical protein